MPKHYKEMMDELINKMDEDAPANNTSGVDMNPTGARMSPKMMKRKKDSFLNLFQKSNYFFWQIYFFLNLSF